MKKLGTVAIEKPLKISKHITLSKVAIYNLHPALDTLQPSPYTLHPTPYTLHPTPYTSALNLAPYTLTNTLSRVGK